MCLSVYVPQRFHLTAKVGIVPTGLLEEGNPFCLHHLGTGVVEAIDLFPAVRSHKSSGESRVVSDERVAQSWLVQGLRLFTVGRRLNQCLKPQTRKGAGLRYLAATKTLFAPPG
jgi:hypothetical protein